MSAISEAVAYIAKERAVIRGAPVAFVSTVLAMSVLIWLAMDWRYGGVIENLRGENGRLHVALGLTPAQSALISLTNVELKAKAATIVSRLNEISREYQNETTAISKKKGVTDAQKQALQEEMEKELNQDFMHDVRADAFNVDTELRRRLGPTGTAAIVGIGPTVTARDGTQISITQLGMTGVGEAMPNFVLGFIPTLSEGIDQMAKALPEKG